MAFLIVWFILLTLVITSLLTNEVPLWLPVLIYLPAAIIRMKERLGNYQDWKKKAERDEELKLLDIADDMASRGLTFSGIRENAEKKAKEDFEFERRRMDRKIWVDLVDSLFLR